MKNYTKKFETFLNASHSTFHAINAMKAQLDECGFIALHEYQDWHIEKGGKYYVIRNSSSIIAFQVGKAITQLQYQIVASHSDSPCFKLKPNIEVDVKHEYTQLACEPYGGMIYSSWMDRMLSIAGRVMLKTPKGIQQQLIDFNEDMVMIPHVAIHLQRDINNAHVYQPQTDLYPLWKTNDQKNTFLDLIASRLKVGAQDIVSHDLYLYNRAECSIWGKNKEFFSGPRLDNLACAFTSLEAFLTSSQDHIVNVFACFDHEEVGSASKQGADSNFLYDVLDRIRISLDNTRTMAAIFASSFLISADNAHAMHPNHPELSDENHPIMMNQGIVVKFHANQHYTTDAHSHAILAMIADKAGVSLQKFASRNDGRCGATLGSILNTHVAIASADIGLAQLSMHAAYETMGKKDMNQMITFLKTFYSVKIIQQETITLNFDTIK